MPTVRLKDIRIDQNLLVADLMDGRTIGVPLTWYPRLANAPPLALRNWQIAGAGYGIHWPDLDEDLSIDGLLDGRPSAEFQRSRF